MSQDQKLGLTARIASVILLLAAIPEGWPYGYFILLRWVVLASAVLTAIQSYQSSRVAWVVIFVLVAFLFNPIAPIHLDKETWVILDVLTAVVFAVSLFAVRSGSSTAQETEH